MAKDQRSEARAYLNWRKSRARRYNKMWDELFLAGLRGKDLLSLVPERRWALARYIESANLAIAELAAYEYKQYRRPKRRARSRS